MRKRLITSLSIAGAILGLGSPLVANAAPSEPVASVTPLDPNLSDGVNRGDVAPTFQDAQYVWAGRSYCWYPGGWHGPGYYWCGYSWRRGFGWGGPVGWNGWRWGYRGGYVRGWHGGWHGGWRGGWHGHPGHWRH
jgi:hypothetical protein